MKKIKIVFYKCKNDVCSEYSREILIDEWLDDEYVFEKIKETIFHISLDAKRIKKEILS